MKIRPFLLAIVAMIALSSCAQTQFTALEQQQISIEDPTLFEKSDAFTIDFSSGRDRDYSFPLPVTVIQPYSCRMPSPMLSTGFSMCSTVPTRQDCLTTHRSAEGKA